MQTYKNLILVGTSHISIESIKEVKRIINLTKPEIVALELDEARFRSLILKKPTKFSFNTFRSLGFKGALFNLVGAWVEKRLGRMVGTEPGSEMLAAIKLAQKNQSKIALIDRDIRITINRLFKLVTFKEKWHFIVDFFKGLLGMNKEFRNINLKKVPDEKFIYLLLDKVKHRYPGFYKALISERNVYMAKHLFTLMSYYPTEIIVAVVGAGHEQDIIKLIKKEEQKNGV